MQFSTIKEPIRKKDKGNFKNSRYLILYSLRFWILKFYLTIHTLYIHIYTGVEPGAGGGHGPHLIFDVIYINICMFSLKKHGSTGLYVFLHRYGAGSTLSWDKFVFLSFLDYKTSYSIQIYLGPPLPPPSLYISYLCYYIYDMFSIVKTG